MAKIKGRKILFCGSGDRGTGMLSAQGILQGLNSVSVYNSAYDLLSEETVLPNLEEDFCGFLRGFPKKPRSIGYAYIKN